MPDPQGSRSTAWQELYQAALLETDPEKLRAVVADLEEALFERGQALYKNNSDDAEHLAIGIATESLLHMKTERLGWPAIHDEPEAKRERARAPGSTA